MVESEEITAVVACDNTLFVQSLAVGVLHPHSELQHAVQYFSLFVFHHVTASTEFE